MNIQEKEESIASLNQNFAGAQAAFVVSYHGCTCEELTGLRRKLNASGSKFAVVKNTLAKRAITDTPAAVLDKLFSGPTAVIWAPTDPVTSAKLVAEFAKSKEVFEIKGGVVDGALVASDDIRLLAMLPSKAELLAKLLGLIAAPATRLVQTINAPATNLVRLLDAWREEKQKSE